MKTVKKLEENKESPSSYSSWYCPPLLGEKNQTSEKKLFLLLLSTLKDISKQNIELSILVMR